MKNTRTDGDRACPQSTQHRAMQSPLNSAGRTKQTSRIPHSLILSLELELLPFIPWFSTRLFAAMANPLRQRLGALLARPPPSIQTSRDAVTKRFFAAKAHQHDDAGRHLISRRSSPAYENSLPLECTRVH